MGLIDEKLNAFRSAGELPDWKFRIGETPGALAEIPDYDGWSTVPIFHNWTAAEGRAWLRRDIVLPDEVNGVSLAGARIDFIHLVPIGSTVYIDGEAKYSAPYWADSVCIPLELTPSFVPGSKHSVAINTNDGDGYGFLVIAQLNIPRLDAEAFELDLIREQLKFCRYLIERKPERVGSEERAFDDAVGALDLGALRENRWAEWKASVGRAVELLMPLNDEAKSYEVRLAAHAHIDMNWLWPWSETVDLCYRDFSTMDSLMERYPGFHFSQSQAATYKAVEEHHPELFERVRRRIDEGRWEVTASTWVEGDLNTALGETLSRHLLHTRRYTDEKLGVRPLLCWEPDTFGHPATFPQVLAKAGVRYYYHCRGGKVAPIYWWEAPDGSRVLAWNDTTGYGGEIWPRWMTLTAIDFEEKAGLKTSMWIFGAGDHGGGATACDIERGIAVNDAPLMPRTVMGSVQDFLGFVEHSGAQFPVVRDELNPLFEGCYTSHADIKRLNRSGENALLTGETLASMASIHAGYTYPSDTYTQAWTNQEFHQFHDIMCGCSIGLTYREAAEKLGPTQDAVREATGDAARRFASRVDTGSGGNRIVVLNQLAWERTDVVQVPLGDLGITPDQVASYSVRDDAGGTSPVQMLDGMLSFIAKDVPSLGCRVYELVSAEPTTPTLFVDEGSRLMENEHLRVRLNADSGAIDLLEMKQTGRVLTLSERWGEFRPNPGSLNILSIYFEQPHRMSAWSIGNITRIDNLITGAEVSLAESGPVCAAFEVKHRFLNSSVKQQIRLYARIDRIDFVTEVDWHERGSSASDAPMLKAVFNPVLGRSKATYEIPYGSIERLADGSEVPALRWADISDEEGGISLLNDCKYGHHAQGNTLALTLLRSSYQPDANPDEGVHRFTYSMYPHSGAWLEAGTHLRGAELNQPMPVVTDTAHVGEVVPGKTYLSCTPDNVIVSAVKPAEPQSSDGRTAIVIRLCEMADRPTTARIETAWPVTSCEECSIIEEPLCPIEVRDGVITVSMAANEVKTLRFAIG